MNVAPHMSTSTTSNVSLATTAPWFESPFADRLADELGVSPEIRRIAADFARDGYAIIDLGLDDATLESAVKGLEGKFVPTTHPYYADTTRIQDAWWWNDAVREIATSPSVLTLLEALYGRRPIPFQTLNFRVGTQQKTHSDTIHFNSLPQGYMCGVWVALEDIDENNGPLHYYPESQRLPIYSMSDIGITASRQIQPYENYELYEEFVQQLMVARRLERFEVKMERGQALLWSANLFHGGSPIRDASRTRLSHVTHYFFSDCIYWTPLMSDLPLGEIAMRKIVDIRTGEEVPHVYNGVVVPRPEDVDAIGRKLSIAEKGVTPEVPIVMPAMPPEGRRGLARWFQRA